MAGLHPSLRKWQAKALTEWRSAGRHGIVAVVTGGGKTVFALHCLHEYRSSVPAATAVIVVPTTALLDQWIDEVTAFFDISLKQLVILNNSRQRVKQSRIHVGVINSVAQIAKNSVTEPVFLIVDECHKAASPVFRGIFQIPSEATLGLSATPERPYDSGLDEILVPNLGPVIFNYTYKEALADRVIVPFHLHNVVFDFNPIEQASYDNLTRAIQSAIRKYGIDSPEAITLMLKRTRLSNRSLSRVRIALQIIAHNRDKSVLIFHEDIAACELINGILQENGILSGVYHSQISLTKRIETLAAYRKGQLRVLVTCRALDEGFNVPEAEVGIIAASTATHRQRVQRLGRILRPSPGKDHAVIYTIVASSPEIRRLAEEANDLEDLVEVTWSKA